MWERPPKGTAVENPAFEIVDSKLIRGVVTELGVYKPGRLGKEVKKAYPELFA